jgi:isoaspartyl peptidase/L-asparaginase-like protein (Ntn-hydrolase superfamily)
VLQPIAVPGGDANNAMTLGAMPRDVTGQLGGGTNTGGAA